VTAVPEVPSTSTLHDRHPLMIKIVLALTIMSFALYSLMGIKRAVLHRHSLAWLSLFGLTAGILGGAYGMNCPPLAIYGAMVDGPHSTFARHFKDNSCLQALPAAASSRVP
jgi:uncharacterized protein